MTLSLGQEGLTTLRSSFTIIMTYRRRFVTILTAHLRSGIVNTLVCCGTAILRFLKETTVNLCLCRKGKEKRPNLI